MADKKDHGQKPLPARGNSTRLLSDFFNEDALPDHLLPEDSFIKKKRNAEKFFEILRYSVFIESIKIYQNFIAFLKDKKEKMEALHNFKSFDVAEFLSTVMTRDPTTTIASQSHEEQQRNFDNLQHKFEYFMSFLNYKIEKLDELIAEKKQAASLTKGESKLLKEHLIRKWKNHLRRIANDPDIEMKLDIVLPLNYQALLTRAYEGFVNLDQKIYAMLEKDLSSMGYDQSLHDIETMLYNKYLGYAKQNLLDLFSFIPEAERSQFIEVQLTELSIQKRLKQFFWLEMALDQKFKDQFIETIALENQTMQLEAEIATCEKYKERFQDIQTNIKGVIEKQGAEINAILSSKSSVLKDLDQQMVNLESLIDHGFDETNLVETMHRQEMGEIQTMLTNVDDLFEDLAAIEVQSENMLKTGMSNLEVKSMMISLEGIDEQNNLLYETSPRAKKTTPGEPETRTVEQDQTSSLSFKK